MYAVFKRELFSFLNSLMAYITIGVFLLACSLLLWFFPDTSILDYGYAEMNSFFNLVPFLFMFLVPAITMRSFAEERKEGTYVLLATKPLSDWQVIFAKYLACIVLLLFALLPTVVYYYSIYQLGLPIGNIDSGAVLGSYMGLFLLANVFTSVGIFSSVLTKNQVVAFAIAVFLCFFAYSGFDSMSKIFELSNLETTLINLGINAHYQSLGRGVLDTRDLIYFITFAALFLALTKWVLGGRKW
ncbi:MAG: gliding motility-associated ABC transporter permease subunit GldF [Bacteroidota bacterium]